jgi:hypothetical protein
MSKCTFGQTKIEYLGHIISQEGVATDPTKISIIQNWPSSKNVTELRSFLGMASYYRRFIKDYGIICRPLFDALKKDAFQWSKIQQQAFQQIKTIMSSPLS